MTPRWEEVQFAENAKVEQMKASMYNNIFIWSHFSSMESTSLSSATWVLKILEY